ncbi:MAG: hypothetical protein FJ030_19215 [Chloroflexi bacterium]|nr:hypothetical protein [Chloroflexota bacterium]
MRNRNFRPFVLLMLGVLLFAAMLPGASANTLALPTPRITLPSGSGGGGGNTAATAAAASTNVAQAAVTAAAAATKASGIKATLTPFATTGSSAATTAITSYASSVLGISVTVKKAGGLTGDVTKSLTQTPSGSQAQLSAVNLAVTSYGALLSNGAASLSYGSGTVTGDVTVDVQGSSLGVYSLMASYSGTLDANSALTLAKNTFPGVSGFSYTQQTVRKAMRGMPKATSRGMM